MATHSEPWSKELSKVTGVVKFATVRAVDPTQCEHLLQESDLYLATLYPPASIFSTPAQDFARAGNLILGAFRTDTATPARPIGCVGYLRSGTEPGVAEIKRLFVSPGFRHLGVATQLMDALEHQAIEAGMTTLRLETGVHQHESLGLYFARGYVQRGPFGTYLDDPYSVFLERLLPAPTAV